MRHSARCGVGMKLLAVFTLWHSVSSMSIARTPKSNLLQGSRHAAGMSTAAVDAGHQQPNSFFVADSEKMDELPNSASNQKPKCHPKCKWDCGTSSCNTKCEPRCQAPKCVTACKKPILAQCKRVCKDPQCAVVCPPQCEHGTCPKCKTVCGASVCALECGAGRCESQCADPDCVWDCKADPVCAKPTCKMSCDTTVCSFGKDQKLPNNHEAPYVGQEIAWKGLGKIPAEHLAEFAPQSFEKVELPNGAKMFGGSQ